MARRRRIGREQCMEVRVAKSGDEASRKIEAEKLVQNE